MTVAPAPERPPSGWWPLDDLPYCGLSPLELGAERLALHGRARQLARALTLPDGDDLTQRLIAQRDGRLWVHAAHLAALCAPLPPARAAAFRTALGLAGPPAGLDEPPEAPPRNARIELLQAASTAGRAEAGHTTASHTGDTHAVPRGTHPDPATHLTRAAKRLVDLPGVLSTYNAALATEALRGVCWHWLDTRSALHLELLGGLGEAAGPGVLAARRALAQVQTTLSGPRRAAARALIAEARAQHLTLHGHQREQRAARRDLIRAAVQAAGDLRRSGALNRVADARWLTPAELRDALDGTLDPATLRGLSQLRRLQHVAGGGVPTWAVVGQQFAAVALSPGVRDGLVQLWQPGETVPEGRIVVVSDLRAWHWPALAGAAAVILDRAGEHSPPALYARSLGVPALGLRGRRPEWLQSGAFVRLNAHQGTLTLLRRAEGPGDTLPRPLAPLIEEAPAATPPDPEPGKPFTPPRPVPREITGISLDFDPV